MTNTNYFSELSRINVTEHIEKKGKFSYLSWAWAVQTLREYDQTATWEVKRFEGVPFMKTECGYFVEVEVTVKGITLGQIHPVLDNFNKPIQKPNAFQINTSIQRCLVKAIALHGLGLHIYAGEDLPPEMNITSEQVGTLKMKAMTFAKLREGTEEVVYNSLGIEDITKLTEGQANEVIRKLEHWIKKAEEMKKEQETEKQGA